MIEALWAGLLLMSFFVLCISTSFKIVENLRNEEKELQKSICRLAREGALHAAACDEATAPNFK